MHVEEEIDNKEKTLRSIIDELEADILFKIESMIIWKKDSFDFYDWAMLYCDCKKIHGLEKRFGCKKWKDIDCDNINYWDFEIDDTPMENLPREGAPPEEESNDAESETDG
jgi:hypothetical protein